MLTQQEIDDICEDAVRIALEQNLDEIASSKHAATDGKEEDIPAVRAWPWF